MRLRTFFADLLANVPSLQTFDQLSPKQGRYEHRRDRSISRAKSDVLKNVQRLYEIPILIFEAAIDQLVKDVIDHLSCRGSPRGCPGRAGTSPAPTNRRRPQ